MSFRMPPLLQNHRFPQQSSPCTHSYRVGAGSRSITPPTYEQLGVKKYGDPSYEFADSGVVKCTWSFKNPLAEDHKRYSVIITNLVASLLVNVVRLPLLRLFGQREIPPLRGEIDDTVAQRIQKEIIVPILGMRPNIGESFDPTWREEARKRVVNISINQFSKEIVYVARTVEKLRQIPLRDAVAVIFTNTNGLAVGIACEALRVQKASTQRELIEITCTG